MEKTQLPAPEALKTWVQRACGDSARKAAIIDPSRYSSIAACREAVGMDESAFFALPNLYEKYAKSIRENGPRLFTAGPESPVWERLFTEAFARQAVSFLVLPESIGGLHEHLLRLVRMPQPDGGTLLFRFQDVVVLSALAPVLTPLQRRALLGPASRWLMADICAHPIAIESLPSSLAKPPAFRLSQAQLDTLDQALAPLTVIFQANETDSTLLAGLSKCQQVQLIGERMHRARQHNLWREDDIALYCILSLQLPDAFDRIGPVAESLERARAHGTGLGDEIDRVPVSRWREWDEMLDARGDQ